MSTAHPTPHAMPTVTSERVKACCADAYGADAVALLLGESYHPGGLGLTRRLADALGLRPGRRVADVACGPGASARLLAAGYGVAVDGVDLGEATLARARAATREAGLQARVRFHLGDAERLPLPDGAFDAVICECALCTFPDKLAAAREFARVLRPGGRVGITDVTVASRRSLPKGLTTLAARVACIAEARPAAEYARLLTDAGLRITRLEGHADVLAGMLDQIEARVALLRITAADRLADAGVDLGAVCRYTALAARALANGTLGYCLLVADKPADKP